MPRRASNSSKRRTRKKQSRRISSVQRSPITETVRAIEHRSSPSSSQRIEPPVFRVLYRNSDATAKYSRARRWAAVRARKAAKRPYGGSQPGAAATQKADGEVIHCCNDRLGGTRDATALFPANQAAA